DRTDAGAPAAERSWLPGHRRQHAGFNNCVEGVALTMFAVVYARTRLGGAEQTEPMQGRRRPSAAGYRVIADSTPVSTTALRGLMASLALPSASPWTAMGMRDRPAGCASCATRLCGALCGGGRPPRGGRRRWFVGGDRTMLAATRRHRCRPGMVTADCAWFARALNRWWRLAALNDQQKMVALTMFAVVYARTRLGGAEQTEPMQGRRRPSAAGYRVIADSTPVSTTALRGLMASLALPSASPWTAMGMRDRPAACASCATRLCGALCGGGRPPRGGRRRWFVGGDRTMLAAPRIGAARRRPMRSSGAINMTLAATRRHRCRPGMVTADCAWFARALNRWWRLAALNDQQKM